jgi:hypothetical protein
MLVAAATPTRRKLDMGSFEKTEKLFSQRGFWTSVVPIVMAQYFAMCLVAVIAISLTGSLNIASAAFVMLAAAATILGPSLGTYYSAKSAHARFIRDAAIRYRALVESGQIVVTPFTILYDRSPGRFGDLLLPNATKSRKRQ